MIWGLYAKLAVAAAILLALGVAVYKIDKNGYNRATAEFTAQRLQEATEANNAIARITLRYREKERAWAQQSAAVSKEYQKRIAANETQRLTDLAAIDARTLVLRDPGTSSQACRDSAPATVASPSVGNGATGTELSPAASRFLLGLASEADSVVAQLTACQAVITSDRQ